MAARKEKPSEVVQFPSTPDPSNVGTAPSETTKAASELSIESTTPDLAEDEKVLDEFEALEAACILDDDDRDEPGESEEISTPQICKNLPKFCHFRSSLMTFDLWGTTDRSGMEEMVYATTKEFAPNFEDDIELRRFRFFETETSDGVVRLVYCQVPDKKGRRPNLWHVSKLAALELSQTCWTTMRTRMKLGQHTYRPSRKDYGTPKFSGRTKGQWLAELKKQDILVIDKKHDFFRKATDADE
jgi:hypothetical protein